MTDGSQPGPTNQTLTVPSQTYSEQSWPWSQVAGNHHPTSHAYMLTDRRGRHGTESRKHTASSTPPWGTQWAGPVPSLSHQDILGQSMHYGYTASISVNHWQSVHTILWPHMSPRRNWNAHLLNCTRLQCATETELGEYRPHMWVT
jgi:hypothetical protein